MASRPALGQTAGFAGEDEKDGLRDLLRRLLAAGVAPRGGVDQVDIPRDELAKRRLGPGAGVVGEEFVVGRFAHLPI